jgi:hypothetical protein
MDILSEGEINTIVSKSKIAPKYNQEVDSMSAYEMLNAKLSASKSEEADEAEQADAKPISKKAIKEEKSTLETILENPVARQVGRTAASIITRSLLGVLGLSSTTRRKKSTSWF